MKGNAASKGRRNTSSVFENFFFLCKYYKEGCGARLNTIAGGQVLFFLIELSGVFI